MSITPEIEADVLQIYRMNPKRFSPFKASNKTGASIGEVMAIIKKNAGVLSDGSEHSGGMGRVDLRPFIVARRRAGEAGWNNNDPAIIEARRQFCEGTHTIATHRDGAWLMLCSIPLRWPNDPRPNYFEAIIA